MSAQIEHAFNLGQTAQDTLFVFKGLDKLFLDRGVNRSYNENGLNPHGGSGH